MTDSTTTIHPDLASLPVSLRPAVMDLLCRLADDKLIMGHRDSEWTGLGPILEADIALSSMAQDKIGHAQWYYAMLHELGERDPDTLAFGRKPEEFRSCSLVALPRGDWAFTIVRQFLFDTADEVRLSALMHSSVKPLADFARKIRGETKYHLMHGRHWLERLSTATTESTQRMQAALDELWPHAIGMFEPTEFDAALEAWRVCPGEAESRRRWEALVRPMLLSTKLRVPAQASPLYGGRRGDQSPELGELLKAMTLVYEIDPGAKW